jgi:GTP cyclohydrolase I
MILEKNISLYSICEHHFVPIVGKAHIAYFADSKIVGLSKLNRIVNYFSKRPQVQEKLTVQIVDFLKKELETNDVACVVDAQHLCVSMRGIKDVNSWTTTAEYSGKFLEDNFKNEFLKLIISETS